MLTEQEVAKSWERLFRGGNPTRDTLNRAESLLDQLRAESPLRHRLSQELEELRKKAKVPEEV